MRTSWQSATHLEVVLEEKCGIILTRHVIMLVCNSILNFMAICFELYCNPILNFGLQSAIRFECKGGQCVLNGNLQLMLNSF